MKKLLFLIFILFIGIKVNAQEFAPGAKSAILMEYSTGKVLYERN